jgi:hypothetical protein
MLNRSLSGRGESFVQPQKKAAPSGSRLYRHEYVCLGLPSPAKVYLKVSSKSPLVP